MLNDRKRKRASGNEVQEADVAEFWRALCVWKGVGGAEDGQRVNRGVGGRLEPIAPHLGGLW